MAAGRRTGSRQGDPAAHHYPDTILRLGGRHGLEVDLRRALSPAQRRRIAAAGPGRRFGVVTAFNPSGVRLRGGENRTRHAHLALWLAALALAHVPADGLSIDRRHRERGFAVAAPRWRVLALGLAFGQTAIFWFDGRRFLLVACRAGARGVALPLRRRRR